MNTGHIILNNLLKMVFRPKKFMWLSLELNQ